MAWFVFEQKMTACKDVKHYCQGDEDAESKRLKHGRDINKIFSLIKFPLAPFEMV